MDIVLVGILLVAGSAAWLFYKKNHRAASIPNPHQPTLRLQGGGKFEFAILGVSRYRSALEKICDANAREPKTVEALLVPEDANPRDKSAVRVEVDRLPKPRQAVPHLVNGRSDDQIISQTTIGDREEPA